MHSEGQTSKNITMRAHLICSAVLILTTLTGADSLPQFSGWAWFTMGRVEHTFTDMDDVNFDKEWLVDFQAGLKMEKRFEFAKARLHFGLTTAYQVIDDTKQDVTFLQRRFAPYLIDAAIENTFHINDNHSLLAEAGYLPVKYNPQARNLGEYLFRSGTYPPYTTSGFELADKEKLTGIHLSYTYKPSSNWIRGELFFNNEMRIYPVHTFSLSYILTANLKGFLEAGAGICHAHLIAPDEQKITPGLDTLNFHPMYPKFRNAGLIDTAGNIAALYTFRGTKAMGRVTIDPKKLFSSETFGKEDLKIYAEAAVLGLKDYSGWYEDIKERIPVMVGFNLPTFKLLDVLALEAQYYDSPYWNTPENVWKQRSPVPYHGAPISNLELFEPVTDHKLKWSIYASRTLMKRIRFSGQLASDNILRTSYLPPPPTPSKHTEICPRTKDWYWMSRLTLLF